MVLKYKQGINDMYYCSRCQRKHRWDSEIGNLHAGVEYFLFRMEIENIEITDLLARAPYNPERIEFMESLCVIQNDRIYLHGQVNRNEI